MNRLRVSLIIFIACFSNKDGIIRYVAYDDEQSAIKAVENFEIDVAWVFDEDYHERIAGFVKSDKNKEPKAVRVYQREDSVVNKLSREVLLGAVYGDISFEVYKDFVTVELVNDRKLTKDEVDYYYDELSWNEQDEMGIINLKVMDTNSAPKQLNYLTAPIRGLLSLLVLLCTLTAAVYYLKDKHDKKYDWLPVNKRIVPAFSLCLCATCFAAIIMLVSLFASDIWTNPLNEVISMLLYIMCVTAFGVAISTFVYSYGVLGALIPGIMIISLVLSPIFFEFNALKFIRLLLPTNYYLNSVYNDSYYLYSIIYCAIMFLVAYVVNLVKNKD